MPRAKGVPVAGRASSAARDASAVGSPPARVGTTRLRWGQVAAREFMRYPGGGSAVPEEEPFTISWVLGMADAVPMRDPVSESITAVIPLPRLIRRKDADISIPRSCMKGTKAAIAGQVLASPAATDHASAPLSSPGRSQLSPGRTHQLSAEQFNTLYGLASSAHQTPHASGSVMSDVPRTHLHSPSALASAAAAVSANAEVQASALLTDQADSSVMPPLLAAQVPPMVTSIDEAAQASNKRAPGKPQPNLSQHLPGARLLGSVDMVEKWRTAHDILRRKTQEEQFRSAKRKRGGVPASRLAAALAAGIPVPLFRPLSSFERRQLFEVDCSPLFAPFTYLEAANAECSAVAQAIGLGRRESKVGCMCQVLQFEDIAAQPLKSLKMQCLMLGLNPEGSKRQIQYRILANARANTGCVKLDLQLPEGVDPMMEFMGNPHQYCGSSRHLEVDQPLQECRNTAVTLAEEVTKDNELFFAKLNGYEPPKTAMDTLDKFIVEASKYYISCPCAFNGIGCHWGTCMCCQDCCDNRPSGDPASTLVDNEAGVYRQMIHMLLQSKPPSERFLEPDVVKAEWEALRNSADDESDEDDFDDLDDDELAPALLHLSGMAEEDELSDTDDMHDDFPASSSKKFSKSRKKKSKGTTAKQSRKKGKRSHVAAPLPEDDFSDVSGTEDDDVPTVKNGSGKKKLNKNAVAGSGAEADALLATVLAASNGGAKRKRNADAGDSQPSNGKRKRTNEEPVSPEPRVDSSFRFEFDPKQDRFLVDGTDGDKTPGPGLT